MKTRRRSWGGAYWEFLQEMRKVHETDRPALYREFAGMVRQNLLRGWIARGTPVRRAR